jgi:hypothetical protein
VRSGQLSRGARGGNWNVIPSLEKVMAFERNVAIGVERIGKGCNLSGFDLITTRKRDVSEYGFTRAYVKELTIIYIII